MKINFQLSTFNFVLIGSVSLLLFSCGGGKNGKMDSAELRKSGIDSIHSVEAKLRNLTTADPTLYNKALLTYSSFATNFPDDTMAAYCLFRAANYASNLNQYQRALSIYDTISKKYPNFKGGAECLFNQAFIYDDKLKDTAHAHKFYQMVIDKYPHTKLDSDAHAAISQLGKSTDEIIREFEEKNKAKAAGANK